MGLSLKGIGNFFGNLFGGDDEDEKRKKQQQQSSQKSQQRNQPTVIQPTQQNQPQVSQQPDNGVNLVLPGQTPNTPAGFPALLQKSTPVAKPKNKIDQMTTAELPKALEEEKNRSSWLDRNITDRGGDQKRAEITARRRATTQYQEVNGYNKQPEVQAAMAQNRAEGDALVKSAAKKTATLDTVAKVADKAGQVAQYVPVTGSVVNLGLAGAERLAKSRGKDAAASDISATRDKLEFGMTPEQMAALPEDQQAKLQNIRNISYAASPLDVLGFGGLAKSTGVNTAKKAAIQLAKEGAVDTATKQAVKEGVKSTVKAAAVPAVVGAGVSAGGQQYLTGDVDPLEAVKAGLMVGGTSLLFPGRELSKTAGAAADEAAPGIKSANPNQDADAAKQIGDQMAQQNAATDARMQMMGDDPLTKRMRTADDTNVPGIPDQMPQGGENFVSPRDVAASELRKTNAEAIGADRGTALERRNAAQTAVPETPVVPEGTDKPAFQHKQDIQAVINRGDQELTDYINANPTLSQQEIDTARMDIQAQVVQRIEDLQVARQGGALPESVSSTPPAANDTSVPAPADANIPVMPAAGDTSVVPPVNEAPALTPEIAPNPDGLPEVPGRAAPETADVAPRTHDALVKQLGPRAQELKGQYGKRAVLNLDDLKNDAEGVVASMTDQELVQTFATADPVTMVTSPESFAIARATLSKLSQSDDPAAAQTIKNLLDGMANFESKSGQGLRIVQEEFDAMPIPMKVRYIVKKIDSANAETKNYAPLSDDPARQAAVEANITAYLQKSQTINESISAIQGQLNDIADAATRGERSEVKPRSLIGTLREQKRNLEANNGELVKYYQDLMPDRTKGQRVNDFARRMMLASFTGRVNDLVTTTANIGNLTATNITQGLLSKAINFVKPGKVTDTLKGTRAFAAGTVEGARKGGAEFGGTQYVGDVAHNLNNNTDMRTGLQKAKGPVGRTIQAATEFATKASEGVRDQRLYQLADQEAAQLGLDGAMRRQYAEARSATPSRQMQAKADQLHMEINNLNENPVTRTLNRVASAIEGQSALGGFLKNQVMPFTSWLGGNIYNSVTDKNVVASTYKFARDAYRGDTEGAVRNLSKSINGAVQAYAIGYALTQAGLITNADAEGYNDAGAYFHIGDRYIPVTFAGFFAPNIVLGNAAFNGLNNEDPNASPAEQIATGAGNALANFAKSLNVAGALGVDNNISRAWEAANRKGGEFTDGLATFAGGAAGQFIPSITGDVNAVLNNGMNLGGMQIIPDSLNPTHERADTKVVDPNSPSGEAKDYVKSAVASVVNRVPFASQMALPRKSDVAADDLVDRTTRGDRDTPGGKDAKATAKTDKEQEADRKKRGVPESQGAIDTKWQNGEYDKAIEGTKYRMAQADKKGELSKSDKLKSETDIRRMETMRDKNISYEDWSAYNKMDLADWRNLGDSESDTYNPDLYQKLYDIDQAMKDAKASENSDDPAKNKFFAKESKKKGGRGGSSDAEKTAKSNTVGSPSFMGKVNFDIPLQKAGSYKAPTIQQLRSSDLVKKRKISVSKG
jgi:hypothetical protein